MPRSVLAGLALTAGLLMTGCASDPTCDELDSINRELADTDADDPAYNDLVEDANRAAADCND